MQSRFKQLDDWVFLRYIKYKDYILMAQVNRTDVPVEQVQPRREPPPREVVEERPRNPATQPRPENPVIRQNEVDVNA